LNSKTVKEMGSLKNITGIAWALGDNINTDDLHPPSFFSMDEEKMKMGIQAGIKNLDAIKGKAINTQGLIIVAGSNFGCGSSRETSVRALIASGVQAVVAKSFARIFYRSLVNLSLSPFVCDTIQPAVRTGDKLTIFPLDRNIEVDGRGVYHTDSVDPHLQSILEQGGLMGYLLGELGIESRRDRRGV